MAARSGLFALEDINVTIRPWTGADSPIASDDQSRVVISIVDASRLLQQRGMGIPLVAFATNYLDSTVIIYFRSDRKIRSPTDLENKSIQYDANSDTGTILEQFLSRTAITRSRLTEVFRESTLDPFLTNDVDVLVGHAGDESRLLMDRQIAFGTLDPRRYGVHALGTLYVAKEATLRQQPETIVKFLKALIKGWELVYADLSISVPVIKAEVTARPSSLGSIRAALEEQRDYLRPGGGRFGELPRHRLAELQAFMLQRRLLRAPLNLRDAINHDLLAEAYRRLR